MTSSNEPQPGHDRPQRPFSQPQPSANQPAYGPSASHVPPPQQQPAPQWQAGPNDTNQQGPSGIGALFDMSFRKYVTPTLAKVIYILTIVMAVLGWLGMVFTFFIGGAAADALGADSGGGAVMGVLALLFGWIPALFQIMLTRVILELAIANIRTAEDADAIRRKLA